jgi:hypothetical protein
MEKGFVYACRGIFLCALKKNNPSESKNMTTVEQETEEVSLGCLPALTCADCSSLRKSVKPPSQNAADSDTSSGVMGFEEFCRLMATTDALRLASHFQ